MPHREILLALSLLAACRAPITAPPAPDIGRVETRHELLPTGKWLDPATLSTPLGAAFPLGAVLASDSRWMAVLLSGYGTQGVAIVDRRSDSVTQIVPQKSAFVGIARSPDGRTLYASGGNQDVVYRYRWDAGRLELDDSLVLAVKAPRAKGTRYAAGIGVSPDGRWVYAAENLADSLAVLDARTGRVAARYPAGRYPYGVAVAPDGMVYVSAWGGNSVAVFAPGGAGEPLQSRGAIAVGRHPSTLLLNRSGSRLFVASASTDRVIVVDTRSRQKLVELLDPPPAGPAEGSTPGGLALSNDERLLGVAEADNNAVAVFRLDGATADFPADAGGTNDDELVGRIPTDWYPTTLLTAGDSLVILTAKGGPPAANPGGTRPGIHGPTSRDQYTLGQLEGTVAQMALPEAGSATLGELTARVTRANRWDSGVRAPFRYPPITHVIYIIKENRTYDQVLGDLPEGDGDTSLVFFPRPVTPNQHALAERFGIHDRFFVNAEVSADGHNWSTAAYVTDYTEQTLQSNYSGRGRTYDYEGTNRLDEDLGRTASDIPEDDVAEPAGGYLWNLAQRAGISFRNFGEFVLRSDDSAESDLPAGYRGVKPFLETHTDSTFPGFDLSIPDQRRADIWLRALAGYERAGRMPTLQIVRLPNDHTSGARAGAPTPRAAVADNDLALGRIIEGLSKSRFWDSTAVFVLEDDAQDGPDHVDSHRSPMLVISPWAASGRDHRWANTTDVLATIAEILHLGSLSQFDFYGAPLRHIWRTKADTSRYVALNPAVPLDETNPAKTGAAIESSSLDLTYEDRNNDDEFNRLLWGMIKGDSVPYPGVTRGDPMTAMGR
jgi:YVTN family beta-propeller protein